MRVEAAALANLAVNDENEVTIAEFGGLPPIVDCARSRARVASEASRAFATSV